MDAKALRDVADDLFKKKAPLNALHQEIADHFYVERADFTMTRSLGTDFASHLMSSYPSQCRRELGNQFSTMLRPTSRPWFHIRRKYEKEGSTQNEVQVWLEYFEETQRRAMYDPNALFVKAARQGDHDYAAFGQCALSIELDQETQTLLYRCWHLRDMCWQENEKGQISFVARKWKPTARTLQKLFGDKVDRKVNEAAEKRPFDQIECLHMVVDADMYSDQPRGRPKFSIYYDCENDHLMDATPIFGKHYVIPRWQTVSGSQYAYSPAAVCALPDARLIQAMTFTLLEASEKGANPPMVATKDAVRSDMALYAGGVTWVDNEYDERLGEALRPIQQDFRGFQFGAQMAVDTRNMLRDAFFINALTLPERAPEMTAYEVAQRVQQYIRTALPIFEPLEQEYNAAVCEETLGILIRNNAFGPVTNWPRELRGADVEFVFESPLHDAIEELKGEQFQRGNALIASAIALDPSSQFVPKTEVALRDALRGIGYPSTWLNTEAFVEEAKANQQQAMAAQQQLAAMEQASNAAKNLGQSGMVPQGVM